MPSLFLRSDPEESEEQASADDEPDQDADATQEVVAPEVAAELAAQAADAANEALAPAVNAAADAVDAADEALAPALAAAQDAVAASQDAVPAVTTTAALVNTKAPPNTVAFAMTVENVAFDKLAANTDLLSDFADAIKTSIANLGGEEPDDVELKLSATSSGGVYVQVEGVAHQGIDLSTIESNLDIAASTGQIAQDVTSSISSLDEIWQASAGAISISSVTAPTLQVDGETAEDATQLNLGASSNTADHAPPPQTAAAAAADAATAAKAAAHAAHTDTNTPYPEERCAPTCLDGRGMCVDGVCFCKDPFEGPRCEKEVQQSAIRLDHLLATALNVLAGIVGFFISFNLFKLFSGSEAPMKEENKYEAQKETWRPTAGT